eukprot:NODE_589_length_723_cov_346.270134_g580_i0.p1 GENE.NODE_589_length_723_cov_346.270134_g580_i0~~NODE_589_length_723_cov_346.270134_g580_i0.p1  ORF type:complete len:101 (-),score=20.33 NODE_589_length_723_cov_346.270134_g580_i0:226-528(-)
MNWDAEDAIFPVKKKQKRPDTPRSAHQQHATINTKRTPVATTATTGQPVPPTQQSQDNATPPLKAHHTKPRRRRSKVKDPFGQLKRPPEVPRCKGREVHY